MKIRHVLAVIAVSAVMALSSASLSGDDKGSCSCGGACNHGVPPELIDSDFLPPLVAMDNTTEVLIASGVTVLEAIHCAASWCMDLIYHMWGKVWEWRRSFDRFVLTGYWQELDYCPMCRERQASKAIKYGLVNSPHQAFATLLVWLKDQKIPHETVSGYLECMNSNFSVLKLLKPVLSKEYKFEAAGYPVEYLSRIINGFAEMVPYSTMVFVDSQFGHMVGVIQTGEQQFSVYFASINKQVAVRNFKDLEVIITGFYRSITLLWDPALQAKIILIGINRCINR